MKEILHGLMLWMILITGVIAMPFITGVSFFGVIHIVWSYGFLLMITE